MYFSNSIIGKPITNLQSFLRYIAYYDKRIPMVIPDGTYGSQTRNCVLKFQEVYNLPKTGTVDHKTWNTIINEYNNLCSINNKPKSINLYPVNCDKITPNTKNIHMYPIQSVLHVLSEHFPNLGKTTISDTYSPESVKIVKNLQKICGLSDTGIIDKQTWSFVTKIYEMFISENRIT